MKCNRCGESMREKDIIIGEDRYGDPIYNRYAFCDQCKVKKNIEDKINTDAPVNISPSISPKPPAYRRNSRKPQKTKRSDGYLNAFITVLAILIILIAVFIVFYLNKSKLPFFNSLVSKSQKTASVEIYPVPIKDILPENTSYGELLKIEV